MTSAQVAFWLPVGRANFFSVSADQILLLRGNGHVCVATTPDTPRLQATVMRRALEVAPYFGYDALASYEVARSDDEGERPVAVTLTLRPRAGASKENPTTHRANEKLEQAKAVDVRLRVDEDGFYRWTAESPDDVNPEHLMAALQSHVHEVIGGDFSLRRFDRHRLNSGFDALQHYKGTAENGGKDPLGILSFFQLNILIEGLINETLFPAVFFEHYGFLEDHLEDHPGDFQSIGSLVNLLAVTRHDPAAISRLTLLEHFLAVTAREVLQRLKWSLESIRRSLLDEMMGVLHRQSRLTQLHLGNVERTPEQSVGANESQLRGYVMLVGAKLPLILNLRRFCTAAATSVQSGTESPGALDAIEALDAFGSGEDDQARRVAQRELQTQLDQWAALLAAIEDNLKGLEKAIEHAWMERLLYEQEQMRAEEEAVAEMERSRKARPPLVSTGIFIDSAALVVTAATIAWTVNNSTRAPGDRSGWGSVWLPAAIGATILICVMVAVGIFRWRQRRGGDSGAYDYEIALRLDEMVNPSQVRDYLRDDGKVTPIPPSIRSAGLRRRGGARIERISSDSVIVKLHSTLSVQFSNRTRAHFEIVTEMLAHKVAEAAEDSQFVLREMRLFGDAPRPLLPEQLVNLLQLAIDATANRLLVEPVNQAKVLSLASPLFVEPPEDPEAAPEVSSPSGATSRAPLEAIA
jgi:hypothetical protein